jgi:C-terminal processing protease CtpA/Prc
MSSREIRNSIQRWRLARRVVLGSILLAGTVATSGAVMYKMAASQCGLQHQANRAYTYSGIGVVIERERGHVVVTRVIKGSPAEGKIVPGARLLRIEGQRLRSVEQWASAIRGEPGSSFELEVSYPCGGTKRVQLTRDIVRVRQ